MKLLSIAAPIIAIGAAQAPSGCDSNGPSTVPVAIATTENADRFQIQKVAKFADSDAYCGNRTVFLIKDLVTGAEYFGLSGVGISELGSHKSGKTITSDER